MALAPKIRSIGKDIERKLKVMSSEVDSTYHTECSTKQSAMDTGSGLLRTWHVNVLCCFPSGDIEVDMQTVVGILVFGRHSTCIALDSRRSSTEDIYTTSLLMLL